MKYIYKESLSKLVLSCIVLTVLFLFQACESDEDLKNTEPGIAGYYQILSAQSDLKVDLNNDGVASSDLMNQVSPFTWAYPGFLLEMHSSNIYMTFPHPSLSYEFFSSPSRYIEYLHNDINGNGYNYLYDKKANTIKIKRLSTDEKTEEEWGRLNSLTVLNDKQLEASITKNYYDFSRESWVELNIKAVYQYVEPIIK